MAKLTQIVLPPGAGRDAKQIAPLSVFENMRFWDKLSKPEQNEVVTEGQQLAAAMITGGMSDLAKGQHLCNIYEVLHPKGYFQKFIRSFTRYSTKQAYRYMNGYRNAAERLSEPVLRVAMAKNIRIFGEDPKKPFGVYTDAVRQLEGRTTGRLGPGGSADNDQVERWLTQVEEYTKERRSRIRKQRGKAGPEPEVGDPDAMLREAYRFASARFKRLPTNHRSRQAWLEKLFGMLLADFGVSGSKSFEPTAVPEDYRPNPVGRPSQKLEAV